MILSPEVQAAKSRAATISIAANTILTVMKLIVGLMMQSVSVISEAVHSGLDLVAAIIAWFAVRKSGKPAMSGTLTCILLCRNRLPWKQGTR